MLGKGYLIAIFFTLLYGIYAQKSLALDTNKVNNLAINAPQETTTKPESASLITVGINVANRNIIDATFVRGFDNGGQAVNFENWLIPFDEVVKALNLNVKNLNNNQLEIRSVGLATRINLDNLAKDPELGLVLSVQQIQTILGVETKFDPLKYAIVFTPPWLNLPNNNRLSQQPVVILDGLPTVSPPQVSLTNISQSINIGTYQINNNQNSYYSQGSLSAIGTVFRGSWYARINQSDLSDTSTWQLSDVQYLRQTPSADYVLGLQPTFWRNQSGDRFLGFTTIQRFGFDSTNYTTNFNPHQRLQSDSVRRTIIGEASPGTLVRLIAGSSNEFIDEILVDNSGVYRFENVKTGGLDSNYRVLLYPQGQLIAKPEIRQATFSNLPGQLSKGSSALIISSGFNTLNQQNNSLGSLDNLQIGIGYRVGVTENFTVGAGLVYDKSILGLGEIFYKPTNIPLQVQIAALMGSFSRGIQYNAAVSYRPFSTLSFDFNSDELSQRFQANWQLLSGLSLRANTDSRNYLGVGINLFKNFNNIYTSTTIDWNNQNSLSWSFYSGYQNLRLALINSQSKNFYQLQYDFYPYSVFLNRETRFDSNQIHELTSLNWRYRSPTRVKDGRNLWEFDLGYGIGSHSSGVIAAAETAIIPGLLLRLRYEGVSVVSDSYNFRLELSPSFNVAPQFSPDNPNWVRWRSQGGFVIQPFLDGNGNGKRDQGEDIYIEDAQLLVKINNQSLSTLQAEINQNGILLNIQPGTYRIDLDPAGYPVDFTPEESAYAVEVAAGGYTTISIPFQRAYTVAGTLSNANGSVVSGAKVEAISTKSGKSIISVTNDSGVFFLEGLTLGTYKLQANNQPVQPEEITLNKDSQPLQEIQIKYVSTSDSLVK